MALNKNIKTFVIDVSFLKLRITIHPVKQAYLTLLVVEKVTILAEYLDFADVFSKKLANVLLKQIRANKHVIKLKEDK